MPARKDIMDLAKQNMKTTDKFKGSNFGRGVCNMVKRNIFKTGW